MSESNTKMLTELSVEIIAAYVANNSLPAAELPALLQSIHSTLGRITGGVKQEEPKVEELKPAVAIKKSVTDDYIICLEDGKHFKSLKRHLHSAYGLSPQDYRTKWGLAKDYPMVAPAYAKSRSALAKTLGLGRKAETPAPVEASAEIPPANDTGRKPRRARSPKAA